MIVCGAASDGIARMDEADFWRMEPSVSVEEDDAGYAVGIRFQPERADAIPVPMQRLLARVSSTLLVIEATLPPQVVWQPAEIVTTDGSDKVNRKETRDPKLGARFHAAIKTLATIARLGWEHGRIPEALTALEQFRSDFAGREATAIWAQRLREGGLAAFATTVCLVALHFTLLKLQPGILGQFENIVLLAAGAPVGFWLSFALAPKP